MRIRKQIILRICGAGLLSSLVLSAVVFLIGLELPYELLDQELSSRAAALQREWAVFDEKPEARARLEGLTALYWVKIRDEQGELLFASDLARTTGLELPRRSGKPYQVKTELPLQRFIADEESDEMASFWCKVVDLDIGGKAYTLQLGRPVENLDAENVELILTIGFGLAASAMVLVLVSSYVAGRILHPIREINRMAQAIDEQTLAMRIPRTMNEDELDELTASLNRMFDRLQMSFIRQKEFIANAAHELKTPVTLLRLSLEEAMQEEHLSEAMQDRLSRLDRILGRLSLLIRNLLELSALDLHEDLCRERFDLCELAARVAEEFMPLLQERQITYRFQGAPSRMIVADREQIRRLFINLFDNGIRYNVFGGELDLAITEQDDELRVCLDNTGPGLAPEDQERVFEQFFRGEKSRAADRGGSGLGLAIAARIVELHGGRIDFTSEPGQKTRVLVFLPLSASR